MILALYWICALDCMVWMAVYVQYNRSGKSRKKKREIDEEEKAVFSCFFFFFLSLFTSFSFVSFLFSSFLFYPFLRMIISSCFLSLHFYSCRGHALRIGKHKNEINKQGKKKSRKENHINFHQQQITQHGSFLKSDIFSLAYYCDSEYGRTSSASARLHGLSGHNV